MTSVTVIVPCYNYARYLTDCANSVLSQDGVDIDLLIIDDQSSDETPAVCRQLAEQDSRVRFIRHETNMGHIATYNEGLGKVTGDYLLLLSADDLITPGSLARATSLMQAQPEIGFTFGNVIDLLRDGSLQTSYPLGEACQSRSFTGPEFIELSGARNIVPTPTAVVRSSLQHKVGGYHPELRHTGDMEMWLRLASHADVGFIGADQGIYRRHTANMSLGYFIDSKLPDLRQRKRALDILFTQSGPYLGADSALRQFLVEDLAREALGQAGMAFNESAFEATEMIKQFALEVSPGARRTLPWMKLAFKQAIGPGSWRLLSTLLGKGAATKP